MHQLQLDFISMNLCTEKMLRNIMNTTGEMSIHQWQSLWNKQLSIVKTGSENKMNCKLPKPKLDSSRE